MSSQDRQWSKVAASYEKEFIDPYLADVRNPIKKYLADHGDPARKVVADLGCGIGPLLPLLSQHYRKVYAIDFARGMLERARKAAPGAVVLTFRNSSNLTGAYGIAVVGAMLIDSILISVVLRQMWNWNRFVVAGLLAWRWRSWKASAARTTPLLTKVVRAAPPPPTGTASERTTRRIPA